MGKNRTYLRTVAGSQDSPSSRSTLRRYPFPSAALARICATLFICILVGASFYPRHTTADSLLLVGPLAVRSLTASSRGSFIFLSSLSDEDHGTKPKPAYNIDAEMEQQINRGLARAKSLIEKSKAKLKAREEADEVRQQQEQQLGSETTPSASTAAVAATPFFVTRTVDREQRMIKAKDEKTGLITADGEAMAAISEQEDWEARPLSEVFTSEIGEKADIYSVVSKQLSQRDVAASIFNLRRQLQLEDYQRIFDKKNYFIGEDV
jgi:hypothetical protein